ncbi:Ras GTPase ras2 [Terramyces sp. JEL0728]|nr:Ras GTPase ras2 [Terramyces sp. JEL0728]
MELNMNELDQSTSFTMFYDPTIEDSYRKQLVVDRQPCILDILDTAGQEEFISLRDQWIKDGEGFLLVYSVTTKSSFDMIESLKQQIVNVKESETVPIIIVGNKCDKKDRQVSYADGVALAAKLSNNNHLGFVETSAKTAFNVDL